MTPKQKAIDKAIDAACDSGQILHRWQIEAFLATLAASGFVVVPVEATEEMTAAAVGQSSAQRFAAKAIYAAMLTAAQKESNNA